MTDYIKMSHLPERFRDRSSRIKDERIAAKIKEYHDRGDDVIFTLDTHENDYLDTSSRRIDGSDGWELYGQTSLLDGYKLQKEYIRFYRSV